MLKKRKKAKNSQSPPGDKEKTAAASSTTAPVAAATKVAPGVASSVTGKILEPATAAPVVVTAASALAEVASA